MRLVVLSVLSIITMFLDQHQVHLEDLRSLRSWGSGAVAPLQYFVDWPVRMYHVAQTNFVSQQTLSAENANLHAQLLLLQGQLQQYFALEKENTQLRALLQSSPRSTERFLVAQLLAIDPEPFVQQVILDKGEKSGVYVGQPVIDADGVFGQVIYVGPNTSRVLLLTDTLSAIPAEDHRSSLRGLVVGRGNAQHLALINMQESADVKVGDTLVTSGLGGNFPPGYPIGTVLKIDHNAGEGFMQIEVEPSAQLNRSQLVLLIWPSKLIIPDNISSMNVPTNSNTSATTTTNKTKNKSGKHNYSLKGAKKK